MRTRDTGLAARSENHGVPKRPLLAKVQAPRMVERGARWQYEWEDTHEFRETIPGLLAGEPLGTQLSGSRDGLGLVQGDIDPIVTTPGET